MVWNVVSGIYTFFFGTRSCFYNAGLKIFTVVDTLYDPTNNPPMSIITHSSTLCYETITNHFAFKTHSRASYQTQFTLKNTRQQQNHEKLSQRSLFIHAIVTDLRATPSDRAPTPDPVLFWATSTNTKHVPTTRSLAPFLVIGPLSAHAKLFFPFFPPSLRCPAQTVWQGRALSGVGVLAGGGTWSAVFWLQRMPTHSVAYWWKCSKGGVNPTTNLARENHAQALLAQQNERFL